ncbi:MAG: BON domain-containing protein [Verrucomicrobiota bacterium]|nr:BON domain-containing protein [Verrucomicrobiota bacterium]
MKNKIRTLLSIGLLAAALLVTGCEKKRSEVTVEVPKGEKTPGEAADDVTITSRVKAALAENTSYKFPDVSVNTFKGTVQLSGFVATRDQKSAAGDIAKKIGGVRDVENKLTVKE